MDVTCLIPAWNEAARIGAVLAAVAGHPLVTRIVVIDDGSTDGTGDIARGFGVTVITTAGNTGKTNALVAGLRHVTGGQVLLLDADLVGLTAGDITRLLMPVLNGRADAALSLRGNAPALWRGIGLDYITGERVLPHALLAPHLDAFTRLPRFGFEVYLNRVLIAMPARLAVVAWPDVASPSKGHKRGSRLAGIKGDLRMMEDIFRTISWQECLAQIRKMRAMTIAETVSP